MAANDKARRQLPKYMEIAGEIRKKIKTGEWPPGHEVPSAATLCDQYGVSMSVAKHALNLLKSGGHVYGVFGVGTFVADRPSPVRISPERQLQSAEATFDSEAEQAIEVRRTTERVAAPADIAEAFGIATGEEVTHTLTRSSEGGQPISISDTYQLIGVEGISGATILEETVSQQVPSVSHAEWLGTPPGEQVRTIRQRFLTADDQAVMISDVSYPIDRYDTFVFRMAIPSDV
ncbi:GntR family transcriptional regulator [Kibdelosporangium persicum]|uniref:HTH-type transcriptional repressor yvoA n=1 Tax=Kibdelosporangium persicum TaxID=2698649 RepID=A0ABX2F524_9PSEU|nr:GntR family transcriptional regulator [Kibdelosporangium persicum]NRN65910.1 HTH-type transcriptional repressor yvoA [Kibdelosporangium persicum]